MTEYKVISTLMWKFESNLSERECMEAAKRQLKAITNTNPCGREYDSFSMRVDLVPLKDRMRLIHIGSFDPEDVFPFITVEDSKREYRIGDEIYEVRMNSERYHVFKSNPYCVACGLQGTRMLLDKNPGDLTPHFNFYAVENDRLVLMTKDHILPKSKGGNDELSNYSTCCAICNNLKGDHDLSYDQVRRLRLLENNHNKLPRKELRNLINKTREEMSQSNIAQRRHNDHITGNSSENSSS